MLETPLGKLILQRNSKNISYSVIPQALNVITGENYIVDARYLLKFDLSDIRPGDIIQCFVDNTIESDIDGGENLALLNLRKDNLLFSIGAYDILYHYYGTNEENFAFRVDYLKNGLEIEFIDLQYLEKCSIAISWMNVNEYRDETATWYASDPCLCKE